VKVVNRINSVNMGDQQSDPAVERDEEAVSQFVERFAATLTDAGFQRMGARVFVALLASESGKLTAAELAEQLRASPAAISGAVRFLVQLSLARRQREPGSRRDFYAVEDDVWYHVIDRRMTAITRWGDQISSGVEAVGKGSVAGSRLTDMVEFFDFMRTELPDVMDRWRDRPKRN
jgi:DNA-binding transcriptional regulator GbsR (MarR family)